MISVTMLVTFIPALSQAFPQNADYVRILPEIVLSVFGMIVMVLEPLLDEKTGQRILGLIALAGTLAGIGAIWFMAQAPGLAFWNMVQVDGFSVFFHVLVIAIAAVVILSSYEYLAVQRIRAGEYYALILFGAVGMALMSSAIELVLIFIALEISSINGAMLSASLRTGTTMETATSGAETGKIGAHRRALLASASYGAGTPRATLKAGLKRDNFAVAVNGKAELARGKPVSHCHRAEHTDQRTGDDIAWVMRQQHKAACRDR